MTQIKLNLKKKKKVPALQDLSDALIVFQCTLFSFLFFPADNTYASRDRH